MRNLCAAWALAAAMATTVAGGQEREKQLAERIASLAEAHHVETDANGHVVRFGVSNHGMHRKGKDAAPRPGVTDADLERLLACRRLRGIFLEIQPLTDDGYALLANFPELTDLRLHYANAKPYRRDGKDIASARFALVVNDMARPLRILELKHLFGIRGTVMGKLKAQPELEKLELDNDFAGPEALPFILAATKVRSLQLHRTSIGEAGLARIVAALMNLELLVLRPTGRADGDTPLRGRSLRALRGHKRLKALYLGINWTDLPYEDGLEHLTTIPTLEYVSLESSRPNLNKDSPQVQALHEARPDLTIRAGKDALGPKSPRDFPQDEHCRWGVCK